METTSTEIPVRPFSLPQLQDEPDRKREQQREAKRRYRERRRFAVVAPSLGITKPVVFANVDSFKRHVIRYIEKQCLDVDIDMAMREIDRIYNEWRPAA